MLSPFFSTPVPMAMDGTAGGVSAKRSDGIAPEQEGVEPGGPVRYESVHMRDQKNALKGVFF